MPRCRRRRMPLWHDLTWTWIEKPMSARLTIKRPPERSGRGSHQASGNNAGQAWVHMHFRGTWFFKPGVQRVVWWKIPTVMLDASCAKFAAETHEKQERISLSLRSWVQLSSSEPRALLMSSWPEFRSIYEKHHSTIWSNKLVWIEWKEAWSGQSGRNSPLLVLGHRGKLIQVLLSALGTYRQRPDRIQSNGLSAELLPRPRRAGPLWFFPAVWLPHAQQTYAQYHNDGGDVVWRQAWFRPAGTKMAEEAVESMSPFTAAVLSHLEDLGIWGFWQVAQLLMMERPHYSLKWISCEITE